MTTADDGTDATEDWYERWVDAVDAAVQAGYLKLEAATTAFVLASYADTSTGRGAPGSERLAANLPIDEAAVAQHLRELLVLHLIEQTGSGPGQTATYDMTLPPEPTFSWPARIVDSVELGDHLTLSLFANEAGDVWPWIVSCTASSKGCACVGCAPHEQLPDGLGFGPTRDVSEHGPKRGAGASTGGAATVVSRRRPTQPERQPDPPQAERQCGTLDDGKPCRVRVGRQGERCWLHVELDMMRAYRDIRWVTVAPPDPSGNNYGPRGDLTHPSAPPRKHVSMTNGGVLCGLIRPGDPRLRGTVRDELAWCRRCLRLLPAAMAYRDADRETDPERQS